MTDIGPLAGVRVERDDALERELRARSLSIGGRRSVWVTDLLDPRAAYYRARHPQPVPAARRQAMDLGRELHARFGRRVTGAAFREVRVHRNGIVGQIDLDEGDPAEVKSATEFPAAPELRRLRPSHLEQLVMYCALVDRPSGHLILIRPTGSVGLEPWAYRVTLGPLEPIRYEMSRRAEVLLSALDRGDPSGLPRCPWRDRGCEFQAAQVCGCLGDERPLDPVALNAIQELDADDGETERLRRLVAQPVPGTGAAPPANRFSDLVYPRQACFRALRPPTATEAEPEPPFERDDLYDHLSLVIDSGAVGESTRAPATEPWVEESVTCFRGVPLLIKVTRARTVPAPDALTQAQPQYFVDLGLRAAAIGQRVGLLLLGVAKSVLPEERLRVYRVDFGEGGLTAVGADRAGRLAACARGEGSPTALPPCPAWKFERCPYRDQCGCGAAPAATASRLQR